MKQMKINWKQFDESNLFLYVDEVIYVVQHFL